MNYFWTRLLASFCKLNNQYKNISYKLNCDVMEILQLIHACDYSFMEFLNFYFSIKLPLNSFGLLYNDYGECNVNFVGLKNSKRPWALTECAKQSLKHAIVFVIGVTIKTAITRWQKLCVKLIKGVTLYLWFS